LAHRLYAGVAKGGFAEVKTRHASRASLAVALAIAQTVQHLESDDVAVRLRRDDDVCASANNLDGAFNPAGFVDRIL
jgi:predicted Zn-dependent protease